MTQQSPTSVLHKLSHARLLQRDRQLTPASPTSVSDRSTRSSRVSCLNTCQGVQANQGEDIARTVYVCTRNTMTMTFNPSNTILGKRPIASLLCQSRPGDAGR